MSRNPNIPATWGIPDDQANQIQETLNKKSICHKDEVQKAIAELARDIAIFEPDPKDWEWWVNYLIAILGDEAKKKHVFNRYLCMVLDLKQLIGN